MKLETHHIPVVDDLRTSTCTTTLNSAEINGLKGMKWKAKNWI